MKNSFKLFLTSLAVMTLGLSACSSAPSIFEKTDPNAKFVTSVTLDSNYLSLEIGDSVTLTPTVTVMEGFEGEYPTQWKSSRPSVASVDNGNVTTHAAGTASINYIAGYKMASCTIVVHGGSENPTHDEDQPEAVGITISITSKTIKVGDTFQLIATTTDESVVTWTSKDDAIATVSSEGIVTGVAAGKVDILATAGEKSATCHVVVNDPSITPVDPEDPDEDDDTTCTVYFFIDYNNVDEKDTSGTKLLKQFRWYGNVPIGTNKPADPTVAPDPAFPYFIGWSSHTIIDSVNDLWDMDKDLIGNEYFIYFYGIWADVPAGGFVK